MTIIWYMVPEIWSMTDTIFCPFTPLTTQKNKILKKWKKNTHRYHHFTQMHQKSWSYAILFLRCDICNCYFSFWAIFCPFTPLLTAPKIKIKKKMEKKLEISSFYICVPKITIGWCMLGTTDEWMYRWMDGQKKWHLEMGAPPKKRGRQKYKN